MLPFTKRPGRTDDIDVVAKDDLVKPLPSASSASPAGAHGAARSVPPSRAPLESISEDEMTSIMARSLTGPLPAVPSRPIPAAGRPATVPPPAVRSRPPAAGASSASVDVARGFGASPSVRPPPSVHSTSSVRPPPVNACDDDEDEDGRTILRDAPKIVRRSSAKGLGPSTSPTSISPAAVIKATLESARANRRENLMPGPPSDLLEDRDDIHGAPSQHTALLGVQSSVSGAGKFGAAAASSYPANYGPLPNASMSVPAVSVPASMPAHFMTPQARYSDPPGTAVTSGHRVAGRPAMSWAAALLICGLFVGVAAVAVLQGSDTVADTTASFVDPSRAPMKAAAQALPAPAQSAPAVATAEASPAPTLAPSPGTRAPAPAPEPSVAATPVVATPPSHGMAFAPVAVPSTPAKAAPRAVAPWKPAPVAAPAPKPAKPQAVAAAPASTEDDSAKVESKKATKSKPAKSEQPDDETKKALEALQKAQLESASSFGKD